MIVWRSDDGVARAFADICGHRGHPLAPGDSGRRLRPTCPYHGWTYGGDGALLAARGLASPCQARNRRLRQLALSEVAGLLLVHQAGLPSPLLAHADRLLRGLGLDRARPVRSGWQPLMWMWRR